jgi:hypothetical protein
MPMYEFKTDDGGILEKHFSIKDAPSIGSRRVIDGQRCTRVVSTSPQVRSEFKPYSSPTLPKGYPGCPTDRRGYSIVTSRDHERQIGKAEGWT